MGKINADILIIDDDNDVLITAEIVLKQVFSNIRTLNSPEVLPKILDKESVDVIILDMNFAYGQTSGREGIYWLKKIREIDPDIQVIMNTAYGDINLAVQAMKDGATDFLVKPWEKEKLISTVKTVLELGRSKKEIKKIKSREKILYTDIDSRFTGMVGESLAMKKVISLIDKVANTEANVLILGENGTGKELVARDIHRRSERKGEVFINVDLSSIPDTLFESELFGHSKGAFTDASEDKAGRFEIASGGTLFLDEIGNLSFNLQSKLLTSIQNKQIFRLGSSNARPVDIRLISATNKPLYKMIMENTFRQDLLYRINTVEIKLPKLKERKEDIPILLDFFLDKQKMKYQKPELIISKEVYKKLQLYSWPGNIRELEHAVERAVIMCDRNILKLNDFLISEGHVDHKEVSNYKISELEKQAIQNALNYCKGSLTCTAQKLGFSRSTLYRKIRKYDI